MVNFGRPSAGCENCRKSKKSCDRQLPSCARCTRLGKTCGGYRDLTELMFRYHNVGGARRLSAPEGSAFIASSSTPNPTRSRDDLAHDFFQEQFVTETFLPFLADSHTDDFLAKAKLACAYVGLANRESAENDSAEREKGRALYIEGLSATNAALRHPRRMKEDNTLISVLLLGLFERLAWDGTSSVSSWKHHIQGATQVVELRERSQIRTRLGRQLFREVRHHIIVNALWCEIEVPDFLVQWTQALEFDQMQIHGDQLVLLASRVATLRKHFRTGETPDQLLIESATIIENDLLAWSEETLRVGSACSFHNIQDPDSPIAWNGTRHEYGIPLAHKAWNKWRCLRILVARVQEAIWRRSWPLLEVRIGMRDAEHYKTIRERMASDICVAVAYTFGENSDSVPARGAFGAGYLCILPLFVAGTVILEHLTDPFLNSEGNQAIYFNQASHLDPANKHSAQLAWIIDKLDYIHNKVGIRWAAATSACLKGELSCCYDLARSRVTKVSSPEGILISEYHGVIPGLSQAQPIIPLGEF